MINNGLLNELQRDLWQRMLHFVKTPLYQLQEEYEESLQAKEHDYEAAQQEKGEPAAEELDDMVTPEGEADKLEVVTLSDESLAKPRTKQKDT